MLQLCGDTVVVIDVVGKSFDYPLSIENKGMKEDLVLESLQVALKDIWQLRS